MTVDAQHVVVCGAGAAGMAAAISAARNGARVDLMERESTIGGTVTGALIHTIAGLYDGNGQRLNDGICEELETRLRRDDSSVDKRRMGRVWVLQVCPNRYHQVVEDWLDSVPHLRKHLNSAVTAVRRAGDQVTAVTTRQQGESIEFQSDAVIDTTGTAEVVRLIDSDLVTDDPLRSGGGLVIRLRGVTPGALEFPRGIAIVRELRDAAAAGDLPSDCRHAWLDGGLHSDEVFVKLFVPIKKELHQGRPANGVCQQAERTQIAVLEFLQSRPEFADASVAQIGRIGIRDGGRIRGEYVLSRDDVVSGRRFPDGIARAAWPIEYWHPERGVQLEYLPEATSYEIPMRSLKLSGLNNVWCAGKCLSADRDAHASARVVGTCWAMGEAVGRAAAQM